ncbi:NB-ARC domain-containing protein [Nonomuraea solani]|uniref:NB-ARC domain-containing protein n=1 Tax=Nonomuraea solani TaxID=1144553 RepID=A0A1H6DU72_9ACTN|nr:FxSxx-COOH system tetratricopeptide repeat protein [Nonomuraea solani]SEG88246.1 NB-ARC domain-containing protein [Nonomuraea solani]
MSGHTEDPPGPSWSELRDALYLAAYQDAAAPRRHRAAWPAQRPAPGNGDHPPPRTEEALRERFAEEFQESQNDTVAHETPEPDPPWFEPSRDEPAPDGAAPRATLPGGHALGMAFKPLRLCRPSADAFEIDEDATAERIAADDLWLPECRPAAEPLFSLRLVVDAHPSMVLWHDLVRRLKKLMEETAAFRTVDVVSVDIAKAGARARRRGGPPSGALGPDHLVLVLTDGLSRGWRTGDAATYLHATALTSPAAALSLMPQEVWEFTFPTAVGAWLDAHRPALPNRLVRVREIRSHSSWLSEPSRVPPYAPVPVPLMELTPGSLGRWAKLVATGGHHDMAVLLTGPQGDLNGRTVRHDAIADPVESRGRELVDLFMARATPAAADLARRLAAAPLNMPVIRAIQDTIPHAESWNLGEIMMFGLLRRRDHGMDVEDAGHVGFDFPDGVREELLGQSTRAATLSVLKEVSRCIGPHLASSIPDGEALVAWQADAADPPVTSRTRPFVRAMCTALSALSGPYLARADRLGELLREDGSRVATQRDSSDTLGSGITEFPEREISPAALGGPVSGSPQIASPATQEEPPRAPRRIGSNLPLRNRNFTGREDLLTELRRRLASEGTTAVLPEALHGMGGVGKSQIAIEYVYRNSKDYQLIWWIPAEQTNSIVQSLIELGEQMGLQAGADRSAVPAVLEALRAGRPYSNWLLVYDNAENPGEVRKFFPNDGPGRVMVTSRNSQWSTLASSLEVDVFTREESIALIKRRSPQILHDAADSLAEALGDLPLAVEQAAVWLAETGMPAHQYLELFETKCAELLEQSPPADYDLPVAAAWNVSLDRLREDYPAALQLLQVCAFFAPEPIDRDFFSRVRGVSAPPALRAALDDPIKLSQSVREIGRYALARIDHRNSTIQVHRLVQRVLIEQMNAQERAEMRHCAHEILSNADPRNPQRPSEWSRYSALLPHVRATTMVECEDPWTRQLVLNEARFLLARSDYTESLELAEEAARTWRPVIGDEHEHMIQADQVRAEALRWQGRHGDAYKLQSELVERCRRVLGERNENTQRALSVLAILVRLRGDFNRARELDRAAYETTLREFDADDPGTLQAAHNYAVSLRLAGDFEEAYRLDEDTHQRLMEVLGDDHRQTLNSLHSLYIDQQELGRFQAALEGQEKLRERAQRLLGEDHSLTIWVSRELSVTRRKIGDHHGAYELSLQVLELLRRVQGGKSLDTVRAALNHATDLRQTGDLAAAAELGRQTMEQCVELLGERHPHAFATQTNLAVTLRLMKQVEAACELDRTAVEGLGEVLGAGHPRTLLARTNLASDAYMMGRFQEAYDTDADVLEHSAQARGEKHSATLAVMANLALDLQSLGRTDEAKKLHDKALALFRKVHGPDHPATRDLENFTRANCDIDLLSI